MRARKQDTTQPAIVKALRDAGYHVEIIGKPVDLMVRMYWWPHNLWILADAKTPNRAGGIHSPRKDQKKQAEFCLTHSVPYWTSPESALDYCSRVFPIR